MWKIVIQIVLLFSDGSRDDITFVPDRPLIERHDVCKNEAGIVGARVETLVAQKRLRILRDPKFAAIIKGHEIVADCWYAEVKIARND